MKNTLFPAIFLAGCFFPATAQMNWQHTGGPNGGSQSNIWSNDNYAFYADQFYLYRTADGLTWEKFPENAIWPLGIRDSTLAGMFTAGNSFAYDQPKTFKISHNNGASWNETNMPPVQYFSTIAVCSYGIYIPDLYGDIIYFSPDEGLTWDTMMPPFSSIADIWSFEDRLYANSVTTLYRTDTNGENWAPLTAPFATGEYVRTMLAHGQNILIATEQNLWHSHDDGQTWNAYPTPHFFENLVLVGNAIFSTSGSTELYKSPDYGITWEALPTASLNVLNIADLATAGGKALAAIYEKGVFHWDEATQSLLPSNQGLSSAVVYALAHNGDKVWAGTPNGVFAYDLPQQNWMPDSPLPIPVITYDFLSADSNLICIGENGRDFFYLSLNGGTTWDTIYPSNNQSGSIYFTALKAFDDVIFIRSYLNLVWWRSADHGQTWQFTGARYVNRFNGTYFAVDWSNNLLISTDKGLTWNAASTNLTGKFGKLFVANDKIFTASVQASGNPWPNRFYVSSDGLDWHYAHDGLPNLGFSDNSPIFDFFPHAEIFERAGKYYLYHSDFGFFASLDTCKTWVPVENNYGLLSVTFADSMFFTGNFGGGVLRSDIPDVYGTLAAGTVYRDDNNNGIREAGESAVPGIRVGLDAPNAWSPFYLTTTNASGVYSLGVTPGANDTLRPMLQSPYLESVNPPYRLVGNGGINLDFGLNLTPDITDLSVQGYHAGRPRPGFDLMLAIQYGNKGTTIPNDAVLSVKLDNYLDFLDATPPPTAVFGDSLVWSLAPIPMFDGGHIRINVNVQASTPLGFVVKSTCRITTAATDVAPVDNLCIVSDTVVGSYDPNEKRVEPADGLTAAEIADGKELLYTIHFQNTGTYPAERVRITDLIDTALYLPSCRFVASSHPVTTFRLKPGGLLEVIFDQIQLPDSLSDEPASHGFVTFALQRKKAYKPNVVVRNYAAIYFDFNEPILTNEVVTPLKTTTVSVGGAAEGTKVSQLRIYPNPAQHTFTVSANGQLSGKGVLVLQNASGQIYREQAVNDSGADVMVPVDHLPDGIYFVRLSGGDRVMAGRVVVVHRNR